MLFNIFLSDLPNIFDSECDPVQLNNSFLHCLMYADDLVILSESSNGLQCALDKLHDYCSKWKLLVNINKTNVMIFNKGVTLSQVNLLIMANHQYKMLVNIVILVLFLFHRDLSRKL